MRQIRQIIRNGSKWITMNATDPDASKLKRHQKASKYIKMHQNTSKCIKIHQHASDVIKIQKMNPNTRPKWAQS